MKKAAVIYVTALTTGLAIGYLLGLFNGMQQAAQEYEEKMAEIKRQMEMNQFR